MQESTAENVLRWHAWRAACESGRDWAEAYDLYLHPSTRVDLESVTQEWAAECVDRHPVGAGAARR